VDPQILEFVDRMSAPAGLAANRSTISMTRSASRCESGGRRGRGRRASRFVRASAASAARKAGTAIAAAEKQRANAAQEAADKIGSANASIAADYEAAFGALSAGALAIAGVLAGLVAAGAALALSASDFRGDMTDVYGKLTGSAEAGSKTYAEIDAIAKRLPGHLEDIHAQARDLIASGMGLDQVEATLTAAADLEAAMGKGAASKLQAIIERSGTEGKFSLSAKQLTGTGVTIDEVYGSIGAKLHLNRKQVEEQLKKGKISAEAGIAGLEDALSKKFGGTAAAQLKDVDVQAAKFKDNVTRLFSGVNTSKFTDALDEVGQLFSEDSVAGKAMGFLVTQVFDGIFDAAAAVLPYVKDAFLDLVIGGLEVYIALKPIIRALDDMGAGAVVLETVGVLIGAWIDSLVTSVQLVAFMADSFLKLTDIALQFWAVVGASMSGVVEWAHEAWDAISGFFSGEKGTGIATAMVEGLIAGLVGAGPAVVTAATGMAGNAIDAIKGKLGIASPSTVLEGIGVNTGEGFALGVDASRAQSDASISALGDARPNPVAGAAGGGGGNITIEVGGIVISGIGGAADILPELEIAAVELFERIALQRGAGLARPEAA
jgi:hypothetical protein